MPKPSPARVAAPPCGWVVGYLWSVPLVIAPGGGLLLIGTWLLMAGLVYPAWFPAWPAGERVLAGALFALLAVGTILGHELGHVWAARRHGVLVRRVTLHLGSASAELPGRLPTAHAEIVISGTGPLVSLGCAAGATVVWLATAGPLAASAYLLASLNLLWTVSNLVPSLPLDGGRVLRGLIWRHTGDYLRATRIVWKTGLVLAGALLLFGVFQWRHGIRHDGVQVFLGVSLALLATRSYQGARYQEFLRSLPAAHLLPPGGRPRQPPARCPRLPATADAWTVLLTLQQTAAGRVALQTEGRILGWLGWDDLPVLPPEPSALWRTLLQMRPGHVLLVTGGGGILVTGLSAAAAYLASVSPATDPRHSLLVLGGLLLLAGVGGLLTHRAAHHAL